MKKLRLSALKLDKRVPRNEKAQHERGPVGKRDPRHGKAELKHAQVEKWGPRHKKKLERAQACAKQKIKLGTNAFHHG